jgi:hypothetical protein
LNPTAKKKELAYVQTILCNNSFPLHLTNNLLEKQKEQENIIINNEKEELKWVTSTVFAKETN